MLLLLLLLLFKMPSALSFMSPASCCLAEPNQLTPHLAPPCMSPTHHVMMSPCRCHHVTMSQCHHVTMSQCCWRPAVLQTRAIAFLVLLFLRLLSCRTPLPIASHHHVLGVTFSPFFGFGATQSMLISLHEQICRHVQWLGITAYDKISHF